MKEQVLEEIYEQFGVASSDDFKNAFNLKVDFRKPYSHSTNYAIFIDFVHPMHASYGKSSQIYYVKGNDSLLDSDCMKSVKSAIRRKISQIRVLEGMRIDAQEKIKKLISDSFTVKIELIDSLDIVWQDWSRYSVAGIIFTYHGTLVDKSVILHTTTSGEYKILADMTDNIRQYFNDKLV